MRRAIIITAAVFAALLIAVFGYREFMVRELRKPVISKVSDPDAALFRNEHYLGPWTVSGGILCGELNVKNAAGAYTGYQWFGATTEFTSFEPPEKRAELDAQGVDRCRSIEARDAAWWWLRW